MNISFRKSTNILYIFLLVFFLQTYSSAQNLIRKTDFGATGFAIANGQGIEVAEIYTGHTADLMGLQSKDIIKKFGAIEVLHMGALLYWLDKKKAGDRFSLMIERNGKREILWGTIERKPYEKGKGITYDEFEWENGAIRTIVNRPESSDKVPAVLFIQDYTCGSVDYAGRNYEIVPKMAAQFAESGLAFIRVEKPGVGDSQVGLRCHEIGFKQEGKMYEEAMEYVKDLDFIDKDKIVILAHGYGGNQVINAVKGGMPCGVLFWGYYANFTSERCKPLRHKKYWKESKAAKKHKNWKKLNSSVQFYHGEFDIVDNGGEEAKALNDYFSGLKMESSYDVYPKSNHYFLQVESDVQTDMFHGDIPNPEFFMKNYNPKLVDDFIYWMKACWNE